MKRSYFLLMIVLGFCSCKKEMADPVVGPVEVDVYVAGYVSGDPNSSDEYPTYWKNGIPVQLVNDYSFKISRAVAIAVSGNDVYVSGYRSIGYTATNYGPMLWKNGSSVDLDLDNSVSGHIYELSSLVVSNNDVYTTAWCSFDNATYFKNESPISLSSGSEGTEATSIAVSGNDVYVAGISFNRNIYYEPRNRMAKYWKNSSEIKLTDGTKNAYAVSIAVSGTDVYVAGSEDSVALYWKNGIPVNLTDGSTRGDANSITVSGRDVYVAGSEWDGQSASTGYRYSIAKYWKNGMPVNLTNGSTWAEAKSIAVAGSDVYVAGFENNVAKYWKNGNPVILGDDSTYSEAYSIFLAKK